MAGPVPANLPLVADTVAVAVTTISIPPLAAMAALLAQGRITNPTTTGQMPPLLDVMAGPAPHHERFQAMVFGKMGSISQAVVINVWRKSFLVILQIPTNNTLVSISRNTMTFLSRLPVRMYLSQ
jgi:hypothetical protein